MDYKAFSIVLTGVQEDAVLSNFAETVRLKTSIKVTFGSRATLVYSAWVSSKKWMFFQEYPSSLRCTMS